MTAVHFYFLKAVLSRLMGLSACSFVNVGREGINSLNYPTILPVQNLCELLVCFLKICWPLSYIFQNSFGSYVNSNWVL